jgi:hypothetical protein
LNICCELWIDGSFLTEKSVPNDIDLTLVVHQKIFEMLGEKTCDEMVRALNGGKVYSPLLDTYMCFQFDYGDPRSGASGESYWARQWGLDRENFLKGFAVIRIGEGDVWHRLFA